jgi:hypothetical protein
MKTLKFFILSLMALTLSCVARGQGYIDSLAHEDHEIASAIAPYPADVRTAILEASQYPQALVKLERLQARTSQSFQDLVSGYPREDQQALYQAGRYPDLLNKLVAAGPGSAQAESLTKAYPEAEQKDIMTAYRTHYSDIVKMNDLYQSSQKSMQKIISKYPANVQDDFQKIVAMPDIMTLLTDNIDVTVGLGEAYQTDPTGVKQHLDSLHSQLQQQNDTDLAAYKKQVENDPKLQDEMKKAADEFATQYNQPDNPTYVVNNYYDNTPYPYWFGYPYWYASPIWYPQPLYFHTGFYYGPSGNMIVCGLPSHLYANWFFGVGYTRYPAMYHNYHGYYDVHHATNITRVNNINVYRGFNHVANRHFTNYVRNPASRSVMFNSPATHVSPGRTAGPYIQPRERNSSPATIIQTAPHYSTAPVQHFNGAGFNHFHAESFHSMGWSHAGGGHFHR